MANVPFHEEVQAFSLALSARVNLLLQANDAAARAASPAAQEDCRYGFASVHVHSCCCLLARTDRFLVDGVWHTWIDYPAFHRLIAAHEADGTDFCAADYMARTPDWALYDIYVHCCEFLK